MSLEYLGWLIIYSADWGWRNPLGQINGCSLDRRETSVGQLFVSSFYIHSLTHRAKSWGRHMGKLSSPWAGTARECKEWFICCNKRRWGGGGRKRDRERQMRTNQTKMRPDLLLFSFLCIFPDPSLAAAQSCLLCVLMHKFRSSTKPWFLYSSQERVMFLSIHSKKSQLICLMTLTFYH